jgi:hypothetical protein
MSDLATEQHDSSANRLSAEEIIREIKALLDSEKIAIVKMARASVSLGDGKRLLLKVARPRARRHGASTLGFAYTLSQTGTPSCLAGAPKSLLWGAGTLD